MARGLQLFLVICVALVFKPEHTEGQSNANEVADKLLAQLKEDPEFKKDTNPLIIDINESFNNFHASRAILPDLGNKLHRDGDATINFDRESRKIEVSLPVALSDLYPEVDFSGKVKVLFWWVHVSGTVYARIGHISLHLGLEIDDFERVSLREFNVKGVGDVKAQRITGINSAVSWIVKLILNGAANQAIVNGIRDGIQSNGKYDLQQAMKNIDGVKLRELLKSLGYS